MQILLHLRILLNVSTASRKVATFSLTKTKGSSARLDSSRLRYLRPPLNVINLMVREKYTAIIYYIE